MKKSIVAMAVCIVMTLMLLPTTVFAEGEVSLRTGTTAIKKGDIVYYGTCASDMNGYSAGEAIQWQVLDAKEDNTGSEGMFLLSKYLLENIQFDAAFGRLEDGRTKYSDWQHSDAQDWCKSFVTSSFAAGEQTGIKVVSKTDKAEEVYDVDWAASELDQEQVFLLSAKEAHDYLSKYDNVAELEATYKNENSGSWWLRSPYADSQYGDEAGFVAPNGIVWGNRWAGAWYAARPAFNLDIDSILFSSAAKGGKSSGAVANGALQEIASNDTSEWKLTLKDSSRASFTAKVNDESEATKAEAYEDDWVIDIEYEGAQAGDNEYVSALLCDEDGNALYYGNIAKGSTSGTAGVKIPSGLSAGTYTLNVFSEQCNGDKMTDYASDFQEIKLTVKHVFGEWEITKEMTETDSGEMIRVCQVCGYEETAEIPMISSGNPGTEASADSTAATNGNDQTAVNTDANAEEPATGDESNMLFFIILAGLSAAGCATVIIRRRSDFGSGRKTER